MHKIWEVITAGTYWETSCASDSLAHINILTITL